MLLDPLTGRGEEATLLAASLLGPDVPLAGGAAGDDLAMHACSVGTRGRSASDAVVIARVGVSVLSASEWPTGIPPSPGPSE